ncbi:MAG: insulinase family protein [Myxococcales bacterium]|nr:insulinase family protein [Myxococcales bacterium]
MPETLPRLGPGEVSVVPLRKALVIVLPFLLFPAAYAEDTGSPASHAAAASATAPGPVLLTETLPNGMRVSILSDPDLTVAATQMWVHVGSAHETESEAGFAHLFEHLMFGRTSTYDKESYSRYHNMNGGVENAYTSFDNTVFISAIALQFHDQVLVYEADRLRNLVIAEDNLENEKKIVTEELRLRTENDPASRLFGPGFAAVFGEHPYGHIPVGTKEDISSANLDLVRKFYDGYYQPGNINLVIAGPVDGPATLARVRELFGPLGGERLVPPVIPPLTNWELPDAVLLQEDLPPIKVAALIYMAPPERDPEYWPYAVMTEMLSGGELDHFREELVGRRHKALEAVTASQSLREGSMMIFASISLPFRVRGRVFKLLYDTQTTLTTGDWLSGESLETTKRRMLRTTLERRYSAASQADAIGSAYAWTGDESLAMGGEIALINAVTLEQVRAVWERYIIAAHPVEVFARKGPAKVEVSK